MKGFRKVASFMGLSHDGALESYTIDNLISIVLLFARASFYVSFNFCFHSSRSFSGRRSSF